GGPAKYGAENAANGNAGAGVVAMTIGSRDDATERCSGNATNRGTCGGVVATVPIPVGPPVTARIAVALRRIAVAGITDRITVSAVGWVTAVAAISRVAIAIAG